MLKCCGTQFCSTVIIKKTVALTGSFLLEYITVWNRVILEEDVPPS